MGGQVTGGNRFGSNKGNESGRNFYSVETSEDESLWLPEITSLKVHDSSKPIQLPLEQPRPLPLLLQPEFNPDRKQAAIAAMAEVSAPARLRIRSELLFLLCKERVVEEIRYEREAGNLFNFVPVTLAVGIIAYFSAPSEPQTLVLIASAIVCLALLLKIQTRGMLYLTTCCAMLFFTGMSVAKWQVERTNMPVPLSDMTSKVQGTVLAVDQNRRGAPRYLISPTSIEGITKQELPRYIRLSAARSSHFFIEGEVISGLARLSPITGPAYPGGYDFAFSARMQGLGMSGFFMGAPKKADGQRPQLGWQTQFALPFQKVRRNIAGRIKEGLSGEAGDIAIALITGDRSGLSVETQESLRRSGLAHILAISGLHMALVTLTVIWIVRLVLVAIPGLVERFPVKKAAIIAGFLTATGYLFISGQAIATQRAWLMITVMLIASLLDRRAITMRSVAIAAIIILLLSPASLFQPGFQMSFAAVAALVAVYREWSDYRIRKQDFGQYDAGRSVFVTGAGKALGYFGGLATTSLIAGLATALFALWHFHRVAPLGLISNLLAMPIVSIAVMPLALIAVLLLPYGYEQLALKPLGNAINSVLAVSEKVNSYALDFDAGIQPLTVLVGSAVFLVIACGLRSWLRWLAMIPLLMLAGTIGRPAAIPDMLIAQDGRTLAIKSSLLFQAAADHEPGLTLLYPKRGAFITDIWQRAYLPNKSFDDLPDRTACNSERCDLNLTIPEAPLLSVVYNPDQLHSACRDADILIAPRLWWARCKGRDRPALILKRSDFEARGSHRLEFTPSGIRIETAWQNPMSDFEENQALRDRQFASKTNAEEAAENSREHTSGPASTRQAGLRPWQKRFDNISRRLPSKTKHSESNTKPGN